VKYAIFRLVEVGDNEAADKLAHWLEIMSERMTPVANVPQLVELLNAWCEAPYVNPDAMVALHTKTRKVLDDLSGTTAGG
jgi:hypothetical protein